jgi:S1-C subfamily serine protease
VKIPVLSLVILNWFLLPALSVSVADAAPAVRGAVRRVSPAVVAISVVRRVYTGGKAGLDSNSATGFVFSADGLALTNHHVVVDAARISCILGDGQEVRAELVGSDATTDIAVLRLRPEQSRKFAVVRFGQTDRLQPGDTVLVIGNPKRLSHTVSLGVVSHPARYFRRTIDSPRVEFGQLYRWLQTDAVIEPGSSGSPVVGLRGRVVGMATRHTGEDLGLAIPADILQEMARRIVTHGHGRLADFGLQFQSLSAAGMPDKSGVVVSSVRAGSAGEAAGLQPGDILLSLGGQPVNASLDENLPEIHRRLAFAEVGRVLHARIRRGDKNLDASLEARPAEPEEGPSFACELWGFTVQALFAKQRRLFDHPEPGLRVSSVGPDSPANLAGLQLHDILDRVGDDEVHNVDSLKAAYDKWLAAPVDCLVLRVLRGRGYCFLPLSGLTEKLEVEDNHGP